MTARPDVSTAQVYVAASTSATAPTEKPRTVRVSRSERIRRARAFDAAMQRHAWTNGMAARRLNVDERFVRKLRDGDRVVRRQHLLLLGAVGAELLSLIES
jgi:hypothetical protein